MTSVPTAPTPGPTAMQMVDGVDLTGKTCVITGASAGLGRESARALAITGAHVVLAARDNKALSGAGGWGGGQVPHAKTSTVALALSSLAGVPRAAEAIQEIAPAIHVL